MRVCVNVCNARVYFAQIGFGKKVVVGASLWDLSAPATGDWQGLGGRLVFLYPGIYNVFITHLEES